MKWTFPIQYITSRNDVKDTVWIESLDGKLYLKKIINSVNDMLKYCLIIFSAKINLKENVKWIKLNANQDGYYRVLYDKENWNAIIEQLHKDYTVFSTKDRMGLISDAFSLCHGNLLDCSITLDLTSYLSKEKNWGPMMVALHHLEKWRKILKYTECYLLLGEYVKAELTKAVTQIGWTDAGTDETKLIRPQILLATVLWGHPEALKEARTILQSHLLNATAIPPNLREVFF
jgi:hypothetical protein